MTNYIDNLNKVSHSIREIYELKNAGHELQIQKHVLAAFRALFEIADHHDIYEINKYVAQMIDNRQAKEDQG